METCSRTGGTFLAKMASGMVARTKCAKKVALGKTNYSEGRGGFTNFARITTGKLAYGKSLRDLSGRRRTSSGCKSPGRARYLDKNNIEDVSFRRRDVSQKYELEKKRNLK